MSSFVRQHFKTTTAGKNPGEGEKGKETTPIQYIGPSINLQVPKI